MGVSPQMHRRALRWTAENDLKRRFGMSDEQVARKVYAAIRGLQLRGIGWKKIVHNALDNPYMTELSRRTLLNDVLRYSSRFNAVRKKKPAQSVRALPAREVAKKLRRAA
jgi:hypothetical protein